MAADAASAPAVAPNPAVVTLLRSTAAAPPPPPPAGAAPPPRSGRVPSQHPAAIRARKRRADETAKRRGQPAAPRPGESAPSPFAPAAPVEGQRMTPALLRAELSSLPPAERVASVEEYGRAVKTTTMIIRAAGLLAAAVFKSEDMKVPDTDARETAELIVDGWPELANGASGDAKKTLAVAAVGSLVFERYSKYQRVKTGAAPGQPAAPPSIPTAPPPSSEPPTGFAMRPVNL